VDIITFYGTIDSAGNNGTRTHKNNGSASDSHVSLFIPLDYKIKSPSLYVLCSPVSEIVIVLQHTLFYGMTGH